MLPYTVYSNARIFRVEGTSVEVLRSPGLYTGICSDDRWNDCLSDSWIYSSGDDLLYSGR